MSTGACVDAGRVTLRNSRLNALEAFDEAARVVGLDVTRLDRSHAYVFELVHPRARLVVPYERPALLHLMTRDMRTLLEVPRCAHLVPLAPQVLSTTTTTQHYACVVDACRTLEFWQGEGFVVVATPTNKGAPTRIKYTGESYVQERRLLLETHVQPLDRHSTYVVDKWLANLGAQLAHFHPPLAHVYADLDAWATGLGGMYCSLLQRRDTMQARGFHTHIEQHIDRPHHRRFFKVRGGNTRQLARYRAA